MDIYHALNRGVDKRTLFLDSQDYARFVHDMYAFNNTAPARHTNRSARLENPPMVDFVSRPLGKNRLVDIHGWVLMKNHYHLLLSERVEGGVTLFLRKLNIGYAKYFNERYKRSGTLFQGRTKKVLIERDTQFLYILLYIHLNPLDYLKGAQKWRMRDKGSTRLSTKDVLEYLSKYRWSSYLDYCGEKNFPSILTTTLFDSEGVGKHQKSIVGYLKETGEDIDQEKILE
ncbi:hypothetical protein K2P56_05020 [Patescibacteria group bacterium]|nr:hypothetical protein [Patescibacteria group bacterium]